MSTCWKTISVSNLSRRSNSSSYYIKCHRYHKHPIKTTSSSSTSSVATTSTTSSKPKPTTVSTSSIASTTTPDGSYSTSFVTVTAETTKVVTITSCSNNACHPTTAPTGLTVVTLTTSDVKTVVTTYCPLTQTVTLGVTGTKTVDLGCPTGYFGYNGYIGKGVSIGHGGAAASASAGFQIGFDIFKTTTFKKLSILLN